MMTSKSKLSITVAAVVALSAGAWLSSLQQQANKGSNSAEIKQKELLAARNNYSPIQGSILPAARKVVIPALTKDDGSTFSADDVTGHWSFLFFGYTNCPDVCPATLSSLAQSKKIAIASNHMFPDVYFVSVDPDRDKVEMLGEYVEYFDKDFIGVTGEEKLIKALTLQMSVVYIKMPAYGDSEAGSHDSGYLVDHSSSILLLNPEGKLVAFFDAPHQPKVILKDFQTVVSLKK
ncbi:MAG: SCO family protein [Gammaproteobacteria bacterium]|nr:SCO family protein [Gammaproteobacteria bacterium]